MLVSHSGYRLEIWLLNNGILRLFCSENVYEQLIARYKLLDSSAIFYFVDVESILIK